MYSKFSNKNYLTFSIKVSIILNLFIIIEISIVIKASGGKHQNIIKFLINSAFDVDIDYAFRQYYYVITIMSLLSEQKFEIDYLNSKCAINLINRFFLIKIYLELFVRTITNFIIIREIEFNKHKTSKYVIIFLYFLDENVIVILTLREIHIVNDLKINVLININIVILEKIDILTSQAKAEINNYNINVFIKIRIKDRAVVHLMHIKKLIIISPHIQLTIPIYYFNFLNRDFFFELDHLDSILYAHFVDSFLHAILIKNNSNQHVKILKNLHLNTIQKADFDNCYYITFEKKNVVKFINHRS